MLLLGLTLSGCLFPSAFDDPVEAPNQDLDETDGPGDLGDLADLADQSDQGDQADMLLCPEGQLDWDEDPQNGCERTIVYVDGDTTTIPADGTALAPFPTVQEAADIADDSNVVVVGRGIYPENVIVANDNAVIVGEDAAIEPLQGVPLSIGGNDVYVADLRLASAGDAYALDVKGEPNLRITATLERLSIDNGGVRFLETTGASLTESTIENVVAPDGDGEIINNVASTGGAAHGMVVKDSDSCLVADTLIRNIEGGQGAQIDSDNGRAGAGGIASGFLIQGVTQCVFRDNSIEDLQAGDGGPGVGGGAIGGNGGRVNGVWLRGAIDNVFEGNAMSGLERGRPAMGSTIVAHPGWALAYYFGDETSEATEVDVTNTIDGSPVIYLNGPEHEGEVIENYVIDTDVEPTSMGAVAVVNTSNVTIRNVSISGITGGGGFHGDVANNGDGSQGRSISGISLENCRNCQVERNAISRLTAGDGGHDNDGVATTNSGGTVRGIDVVDCDDVVLISNTLTDLASGDGGSDPMLTNGRAQGGRNRGISIESSDRVQVVGTFIDNLVAGQGGERQGNNQGIFLGRSADGLLYNNAIGNLNDGDLSPCILVSDAARPTISFLTCHNAYRAVQVSSGQTTPVVVRHVVGSAHTEACFYNYNSAPANDPSVLDVDYALCNGTFQVNATLGANIFNIDPQLDLSAPGLHLLPTSPGIDAGDPNIDACLEPPSNGCRVNLGAYGGLPDATPGSSAVTHCDCPP